MDSALLGFLKLECDDQIAGWLRGAVVEANGAGYDEFNFNLFDVEFFHAESRVTIKEAAGLEYENAELPLGELLGLLPDVPPSPPPREDRRVIILPPPIDG